MSCSCNASAVRLFARGLVQVHRLEPSPSFALPIRGASGGARFTGGALASQQQQQRRSLHASPRALGDAENPAPVLQPSPDNRQPAPAAESSSILPTESSSTSTTTSQQPAAVRADPAASRTKTHEECMTEARARAAWRFKQQGFDWKAFRSKDPAVRAKADLSNFDWKHWQGKKQGSRKLNQLVDNLEAARAEDRAAVGITPREGGVEDQRRRRAPLPTTAAASRHMERPEYDGTPPRKREEWMIQKEAAKAKFPDGWKPHKRLSPDALAGIRALNAQFPDVYTTQALAERFAVSPEAIRRILKSKWTPSSQEEEDRQGRWHRRGVDVWARKAELGIKPPRRWRDEGIAREPAYHERKAAARQGRAEQVRREREEYMRSFAKRGSEEVGGSTTTADGASGGGRRGGDDDGRQTRSTGGKAPPPWGARRGGPSSARQQTKSEAGQDVFDQALASERRE
ncbi:Neugrin-related protein [Akanthomyces lecanii RCEF 1005]|uniref:Required for respiratory growth protein 9, mitochondrial n=1 Tax=Akanthomyces lecanii RCEF 1005 TaxID=1081108 RepID=A0A168IQQ3_CORDF|nr:Neugrin-related protein [Akanthomyces lecanii RCEF 1005]